MARSKVGPLAPMDAPVLVIFDCDGVLIDSEVIACRADAACLREIGIDIPADEIMDRYVGISAAAMLADIAARHGTALPADFGERLRRRTEADFASALQPIRGVQDMLARLPGGGRCVASSSTPERLRHSLALTGLLHWFEPNLFSASQVTCGKPAPDLFLLAAREMAVPPCRCLVIEDSVAGVAAARAADMRVFGFEGGSHCRAGHAERLRRAGAETVFADMRQLPELISRCAARARVG